jgi:hypothetical protein
MTLAAARLQANIAKRLNFEAAVEAALRIAAEHGHRKPLDIALHLRVELDRRGLQVDATAGTFAPSTYIDARGRTVRIDA